MSKGISWQELAHCQTYAEHVLDFYRMCNNGKLPMTAGDAEQAVREYNKERRSFKAMFGYSIRGYMDEIVARISFMVEE